MCVYLMTVCFCSLNPFINTSPSSSFLLTSPSLSVSSQADDVKALLSDAMIKDIPCQSIQLQKASKVDIAIKGLTAAGASLLASELVLGDGGEVQDAAASSTYMPAMAVSRAGAEGIGDGSELGFQDTSENGNFLALTV